ncbi:MAG: radical SAM protein [Prevotella sp.]|jgi:MoaA/NifB/PqqE/SkfB family radical SAM enzyme|nr:radical SAM protein [Prevotella sp.]
MYDKIFESIKGIYTHERDEIGIFAWANKEIIIDDFVIKRSGFLICVDIPDDIAPIEIIVRKKNVFRKLICNKGVHILPTGVISAKFSRSKFHSDDSRELSVKIRIINKFTEIGGVQIEIEEFEQKDECYSNSRYRTKITLPIAESLDYYDIFVHFDRDDPVSLTNGTYLSLIKLRNNINTISIGSLNINEKTEYCVNHAIIVIDVKKRVDWFDFMNLESDFIDKDNCDAFLHRANNLSSLIPKYVQWYVTWKCNYSCKYCWQESNQEFYRNAPITKVAPEIWANAINKLKPKFLYLTGGEPTLYKQLPEFLSMLNKSIKIVMTTNLEAMNIDRFTSLVSPSQFDELTVSFHPTQVDKERFEKRISKLYNSGFYAIGIEMVLHPMNLSMINFLNSLVETLRIKVRYDDYTPVIGRFVPSQEENRKILFAKEFSERHNKEILSHAPTDTFKRYQSIDTKETDDSERKILINSALCEHNYIYCGAGMVKLTVDGIGNVYACTSAIDRSRLFGHEALPHYQILGNILEGTFNWHTRAFLCNEAFRCSACDYAYLDRGWIPVVLKKKYPIPE